MIIPYLKYEGIIRLRSNIYKDRRNDIKLDDDITCCCHDMYLQLDMGLVEIRGDLDPPILIFTTLKNTEPRIVRFCPNCGEKVETKRIEPKRKD